MSLSVTEVQKALKGADYPASRDELASQARDNGAGEVADALAGLDDKEYSDPTEVMEAMKGRVGGDA